MRRLLTVVTATLIINCQRPAQQMARTSNPDSLATIMIVDCDMRARAVTGDYEAAFFVCLEDRFALDLRRAATIASAMSERRGVFAKTQTNSSYWAWDAFGRYRSELHDAAASLGSQPAWADAMLQDDSIKLAEIMKSPCCR